MISILSANTFGGSSARFIENTRLTRGNFMRFAQVWLILPPLLVLSPVCATWWSVNISNNLNCCNDKILLAYSFQLSWRSFNPQSHQHPQAMPWPQIPWRCLRAPFNWDYIASASLVFENNSSASCKDLDESSLDLHLAPSSYFDDVYVTTTITTLLHPRLSYPWGSTNHNRYPQKLHPVLFNTNIQSSFPNHVVQHPQLLDDHGE